MADVFDEVAQKSDVFDTLAEAPTPAPEVQRPAPIQKPGFLERFARAAAQADETPTISGLGDIPETHMEIALPRVGYTPMPTDQEPANLSAFGIPSPIMESITRGDARKARAIGINAAATAAEGLIHPTAPAILGGAVVAPEVVLPVLTAQMGKSGAVNLAEGIEAMRAGREEEGVLKIGAAIPELGFAAAPALHPKAFVGQPKPGSLAERAGEVLGRRLAESGVQLPRSLAALGEAAPTPIQFRPFIPARVQAGERAGVPVAKEGAPVTEPVHPLLAAAKAVDDVSLRIAQAGEAPHQTVTAALDNLRAELEAARQRASQAGQVPAEATAEAMAAGREAPGAAADVAFDAANAALDEALALVNRGRDPAVPEPQYAATIAEALAKAAAAVRAYQFPPQTQPKQQEVSDAVHESTEGTVRTLQQSGGTQEGTREMPANVAGEEAGARSGTTANASEGQVSLTTETPKPPETAKEAAPVTPRPERGLPEGATDIDLIADMTQAGRDLLERVKATKDEFTGVDATDLSSADRRNLARLGVQLRVNRNNRVEATWPASKRAEALRKAVQEKRASSAETPVGEGPGAATPSEFGPENPFTTSVKNEITAQKRATRGMPAVREEAAREWGTVWDEVQKEVEDNPGAGQRLVEELQKRPRPVSDRENALLLHEEIGLEDLYNKTVKLMLDAAETGGDTAIPDYRLRLDEISNQMQNLFDVTKIVGRETARGLNARKMIANENYTLVKMLGAKRAMKDGQPLTEAEQAEITALHDQIKKAQEAYDDYVSKSEGRISELETQHAIDELKIAAARERQADRASGTQRDTAAERENIIAGIGERANNPIGDLRPWIRKLALNFIRSGITERDPLVTAVHDVLKEIIPTIERRQTMDAISGYGDFRPLDPEVSKAKLRDLSGQMQNVSKLEDLLARKALKKTGMERKTPSDEERRLMKLVNEYKKRYGVVVTDPAKQLKSALDAVKTRLTHQIADLDFQIKTGKKIIKGKTKVEYDAEAQALVKRRDELKAQFDEIFGKPELTDEQRVAMAKKSLENSIAELQRRIAAGETRTPRKPSKTPITEQLQVLRDERDALRAQLEEMRDADVMLQEDKAIKSLQSSIAEYERRLKENDLFQEKREGIETPATQALKQQRDALAEELARRRAASPEADAKRIGQIQKDIAELERKIAAGELETRKPTRPVSAEELKYRELRDQTRRILQDLREKSGMYDAERIAKANKTVDAAIEESIRQINEGDLAVRRTPTRATTPELEAKRAELAELQKIKQQLRNAAKPKKTADEIAIAALKTRLRTGISDLNYRLLVGDFAPRVRKPVPLDPEAMRLKRQMMLAKAKFQEALEIDRINAMSPGRRIFYEAGQGLDAIRTILTSLDLSALLRQGKFVVLSRPGLAAKSTRAMFDALMSKERAFKIDQEILNRKNYPVYNQSGLYLAEHGKRLSRMEEAYMGGLVERMERSPHRAFREVVRPVAASQRAYTTFLNKLRADSFDALANTLSQHRPITPVEGKAIANYINVATGRGSFGDMKTAGVALNRIFFSPRYVASRFQYMLGQPLYQGTARTRALIAGEYAKTLIGYAVFYTLAKLAFPESTVSTDTRSSDAGKIVIGNTRIDPLAGLQQNTVLLDRLLLSGETKFLSGQVQPTESSKVIANWLRSKLAPVPGAAVNIAGAVRNEYLGREPFKDMSGQEVTPRSVAESLIVPLAYQDIFKVMQDQGIPRGLALQLLSIFGEGVQVYDE